MTTTSMTFWVVSNMKVTTYEKTEMHCGACVNMEGAYNAWLKSADEQPERDRFSAEENVDKLYELGATVAPVWIIDYEDGTEPAIVIGDDIDGLTDALESGTLDVWG